MAAQHLHRPRRRSAVDLVRYLTGVQAQVLSGAGLALRARTGGLTGERVTRARVRDRSIILTWAMRGTLHLIAAEDYGWLAPLVVEPRMANAHRRLKEEGVPAAQHAKAVRLIERMLEREGLLTRREVAERLRSRGIRTEGQAIAHLLWLASAEGVICHGPDRGHEQSFVLVRDWVGEPAAMDREEALSELALRYLAAHGPSEPADLASWSGLRLGDANRAWRAIGDRLVEVRTTRGTRWTLSSQEDRAPRRLVRLLPAFDEYLLGWRDREPLVSPEDWRRVNRGGGWLRAVVIADGRVLATWNTERMRRGLRLHVDSFSRLTPTLRRGIAAETEEIGSFLETPVAVDP
jgi:hypothetical protein